MKIEFKYSQICDLVFHVLAFMRVNNASNLYSKEYIDTFPNSIESGLLNKVSKLENYYNDNFERLGIINFLPIYCSGLDSLRNSLLSYNGFSSEDIKYFIKPFIEILEYAFPEFTEFWEKKENKLSHEKVKLQQYISEFLNSYKKIFDYYGKNAEVYFSINLTCNGRGIYSENSLSAIVPYPKTANDWSACFFQLFHEYTHQFTDKLISTDIRMTDGSHELSEKLVILADYFIFRKTDEQTAKNYLDWINWTVKNSGQEITAVDEAMFLNIFRIPPDLMRLLDTELAKIYQ